MPGSPVFSPFDLPRTIPFRLSQYNGRGSTPLRLGLYTQTLLTRRPLKYSTQDLGENEAGSNLWEAGFFKGEWSDTHYFGDLPYRSVWVTTAALTRLQRWASRDYALRKVMDDWFLGTPGTWGNVVERWRPDGLNSWGGRSVWTTRPSLTPPLGWANADTLLQEKFEDWFFGRTAGSPDMHIMYTRAPYPLEKQLRLTVVLGRAVEHPSRRVFDFFVTTESLARVDRWANDEDALETVAERWFFGHQSYPSYRQVLTIE